jgi:hypothetical protein
LEVVRPRVVELALVFGVTVVTDAIPFTVDLMTASSSVDSRTNNCMGIGCGMLAWCIILHSVPEATYKLADVVFF